MGVLGAAGERRIVRFGGGGLKRGAELVPTLAEIHLTRPPKHAVGQLAGAKAGKADQLRLLLWRRRSILLGDGIGNEDRRDIGASTILPGRR